MAPRSFVRTRATVACALSLVLTTQTGGLAFAATNDSIKPLGTAGSLTSQIEETTRVYREAEAELESINAQIVENEAKVADIEARLPGQRAKAASSIRTLYKFQQSAPGLIDLIISAEDFNDFISTLHYIDSITERNTAEITALNDLQDALVQTQSSLFAARDAAIKQQEEARSALEQARSTRQAVAQYADDVAVREADARAAALAAAQAMVSTASSSGTTALPTSTTSSDAHNDRPSTSTSTQDGTAQHTSTPTSAAAEQPAAQTPATQQPTSEPASPAATDSGATFTTASGGTAAVEVAPEPSASTDPIVSNTTSSEVDDWASRIDAYLEGTELAGYGSAFAQAASDYGVDPRIAPAIAGVESGWGQVCFLDHNAWGWGTQSWDSWESAIDHYVSGYSDIYGSTITLEGAEMYASNDIYDVWYSTVLSEMDSI